MKKHHSTRVLPEMKTNLPEIKQTPVKAKVKVEISPSRLSPKRWSNASPTILSTLKLIKVPEMKDEPEIELLEVPQDPYIDIKVSPSE